MIPLDQYQRNILAEQAETAAAEAAERERIEKAEAAERYSKLDELCNNANFQWFMNEFVRPLKETSQKDALDVRKSPEERNNHCHQHEMASKILGLAEDRLTFYRQKAGYTD